MDWRKIIVALSLAAASLPLQAPTRGAVVDPPGPVPRDSFAMVKCTPGSMLGVVGIQNGKFVQTRAYFDATAGVLIFNGPPGSYLVHGNEDGNMVQLIVEIAGGEIPDPDDDDVVDPDPPGPGPDVDVSNVMGVGKAAYTVARSIGDKAGAAKLAAVYRDCEVKMHQGSLLPVGAEALAEQACDAAGGKWPGWFDQTRKVVGTAIDKHGSGMTTQKNIWREIRLALEAAAK